GHLLRAESIGGDGEPVRWAVDVRIVDLVGIAGEDDLRPVAGARDDRLYLVRREVLRLVDDHELVRQRSTANVRQRLDLDLAALQELGVGARALSTGRREQELEVVEDRLHPRIELLV